MKTKQLDPQNLGPSEDWLGNNAAFACPQCGQVYLVSGFLKHERPCPRCGKSRAHVTGSSSRGGKAVITWDDFELGKKYSRKEISRILGGSEVDYLPMEKNRVVCGCFTLDHNPAAPAVVMLSYPHRASTTLVKALDNWYA